MMIGGLMLLLIVLPMFCCRVSDDKYNSILRKIQEGQVKAEIDTNSNPHTK